LQRTVKRFRYPFPCDAEKSGKLWMTIAVLHHHHHHQQQQQEFSVA